MELASQGLYTGGGKWRRSQVPLLRHDVQITLVFLPDPGVIYSKLVADQGARISRCVDSYETG